MEHSEKLQCIVCSARISWRDSSPVPRSIGQLLKALQDRAGPDDVISPETVTRITQAEAIGGEMRLCAKCRLRMAAPATASDPKRTQPHPTPPEQAAKSKAGARMDATGELFA